MQWFGLCSFQCEFAGKRWVLACRLPGLVKINPGATGRTGEGLSRRLGLRAGGLKAANPLQET